MPPQSRKNSYFLQIGYVSINSSVLLVLRHVQKLDAVINTELIIDGATYMNILILSALLLVCVNINDWKRIDLNNNINNNESACSDIDGSCKVGYLKYVVKSKEQPQEQLNVSKIEKKFDNEGDEDDNESGAETLFEDSLEDISDKNLEFSSNKDENIERKKDDEEEDLLDSKEPQKLIKIDKFDSISSELEYFKKKNYKLKMDNHDYLVKNNSLKSKLRSQSIEIKALKRTISSSMQILNSHIKENNRMYDKIHDLQHDFNLLDNKFEFDNFLKNEKSQIDNQIEKINQLLKNNNILKKELDFKNKVFHDLFEESGRLQSKADNNKEQIRILNSKLDTCNKEKNKLLQTIQDLNKRKTRNDEKSFRVFKENKLLHSDIENLKDLNSNLIEENVEVAKKLKNSQNKLKATIVINKELSKSNNELSIKNEKISRIRENHESFIRNTMIPIILNYEIKFKSLVTSLQTVSSQFTKCQTFLNEDLKISLISELNLRNLRFQKTLKNCLKENSQLKNQLELSKIESNSYKNQIKLNEEMLNIFKSDEKDITFSCFNDDNQTYNCCAADKVEQQKELQSHDNEIYRDDQKITLPPDGSLINCTDESMNDCCFNASLKIPRIHTKANDIFVESINSNQIQPLLNDSLNFEKSILDLMCINKGNSAAHSNNNDFQSGLRSMVCELAEDFHKLKNYSSIITIDSSNDCTSNCNIDKKGLIAVQRINQKNTPNMCKAKPNVYKDTNNNINSINTTITSSSIHSYNARTPFSKENENPFSGHTGELTPVKKKISILLEKQSNTYTYNNANRLSAKPKHFVNI